MQARRSAWSWVAGVLTLGLASGSVAADPQASPGQAGRLAGRDLIAFAEFDGLDAHSRAWDATAARGIVEGTSAGAMVDEVARQVLDRALGLAGAPGNGGGPDLVAIGHHLARRGFAVAAYRPGPERVGLVVVLPGLGAGEARERFDRLVGPNLAAPGAPVRGRSVTRLARGQAAWWAEGADLFLAAAGDAPPAALDGVPAPSTVDALLAATFDAIERKAADASTHPGWVAAKAQGADLPGFEPSGLFFAEADALALAARLVGDAGPYRGLELPSGKYIHDDVKHFDADLDRLKAQVDALKLDDLKLEVPPPIGVAEPIPIKAAEGPPVAPAVPAPVPSVPAPPAAGLQGVADRPTADPARGLGLDSVRRVVGRWGFDGRALVTDVRVEAPAPRRGMLALLDQPTFAKDQLPAIPAGVRSFAAGSFDLERTVKAGLDAIGRLDPTLTSAEGPTGQAIARGAELLARHDILGAIGPRWAAFAIRGDDDQGRDQGRGRAFYAVTASLADPARFGRGLDALAEAANRTLQEATAGPGEVAALRLEPLLGAGEGEGSGRGYRLTSPGRLVFWLSDNFQPTILVDGDRVALAANPDSARAALGVGGARWQPDGEVARALALLPDRLTSLSVSDPANSTWPTLIASLPTLVQASATMLEADAGSEAAPGLLGLLGVPGPGGLRLRIAPEQVPRAEAIRASLFPGVAATVADDRGFRWIAREPLPVDGLISFLEIKYSAGLGKPASLEVEMKLTNPAKGD